MKPKIIDCRGLNCPQPVLNTKKALDNRENMIITTIVDNDIARQNVTMFARNRGHLLTEEVKEGHYYITITRVGGDVTATGNERKKEVPPPEQNQATGPCYFVTSNQLGQGSADLGHVLIKSLFVTLAATSPPPASLLFLNTGVFLVCRTSPVLEQLKQLQEQGTAILACGTCLNYYKLSDQLVLGRVSNMLDINNKLLEANKVITVS